MSLISCAQCVALIVCVLNFHGDHVALTVSGFEVVTRTFGIRQDSF